MKKMRIPFTKYFIGKSVKATGYFALFTKEFGNWKYSPYPDITPITNEYYWKEI